MVDGVIWFEPAHSDLANERRGGGVRSLVRAVRSLVRAVDFHL